MNNVFKILAVSAIVLGSVNLNAAGAAAPEESLLDAAFGPGSFSAGCFAPTSEEIDASVRFDIVLNQLVRTRDLDEAKILKRELEVLASVGGLVDGRGNPVLSAFDAYRKYLMQIAQNEVDDTYGNQTMGTRAQIFYYYAQLAEGNWQKFSE